MRNSNGSKRWDEVMIGMKDYEEYRDTGMLGAYHPWNAILRGTEDGGIDTIFRDTRYSIQEAGVTMERELLIQGKVYRVTSVFTAAPTSTPTEKMLALIASELEKDHRSA